MPQNYPNRSDLRDRPTYGEKKASADAQRAVPVGAPPTAGGASPVGPAPGSFGDFLRPSNRPNEPITAGANFGPGSTALQAGIPVFEPGMMAKNEVMAIARMFPSDDLDDLLDKYGNDL